MEGIRQIGRSAAFAALLVAALMAGGLWLLVRGAAPAASTASPAPALAGVTLSGSALDLSDLRGSVVLVHVWASWCAPCREELPRLVATGRDYAARGLRVVGIDTRDGERQARELLERVGGDPGSSVVDPEGRIAAAWEARGVPETFVVDADGTVRARHLGPVDRAWLDETLPPLLAAA